MTFEEEYDIISKVIKTRLADDKEQIMDHLPRGLFIIEENEFFDIEVVDVIDYLTPPNPWVEYEMKKHLIMLLEWRLMPIEKKCNEVLFQTEKTHISSGKISYGVYWLNELTEYKYL